MGYLLNSLGNLPIDDDVSLYIFVINGGFNSPHFAAIEQNFSEIARRIGDNSVIAKGFTEEFYGEVCRKYLNKELRELFPHLPALLLTDAHPDRINDKSMRLLIPLKHAEKEFGDLSFFFRALSDFAQHRNTMFFDKFEDRTDWFEAADAVIEVKPKFFGIGININELIKRLRPKVA